MSHFNFTDLQIHPEQLPSAHPDLTAKYTVPVPSGFMHAYGDVWMRFPRPFPTRMAYDFDATVVSVKEGKRSVYLVGRRNTRTKMVDAYKIVLRTKYGFSVWGTVGDPSKGPSPLKVGDKVRIKDFVPTTFRRDDWSFEGAEKNSTPIYRNEASTVLHGVITNQSRPPYYRMPMHGPLKQKWGHDYFAIYGNFPKVETISWSHVEKKWNGMIGGNEGRGHQPRHVIRAHSERERRSLGG